MLTLPIVVLILERAKHPWLPLEWLTKPSLHSIYDKFYSLAGNANFPSSTGGKGIVLAYGVVCFIAVLSTARLWRRDGWSSEIWGTAMLLVWLLVPMVLAVLISLVQPMFMNRYLLMTIPALVLLAALGVRKLRPVSLSVCATLVLLALGTARLPQYYRHRATFHEWQAVTNM